MKFSIITVVKDELFKIGLSVQSLKNQTFKDYEHIIFDGESIDGTSEFLKKNLNHKTLYFREKDNGVYDAINKSFKKVSGEYILLLHAGDFFYSQDSLDQLAKFIDKNNNFDFFYSNLLFYNLSNLNVTRVWNIASNNNNKLNFLKIAHTTLCINKRISKNLFYDHKFKISADTDYLYNICRNFNKFFEDIQILYKRFNIFFLIILMYKYFIKIPGIFNKEKKFNKLLNIEINKLI